MVVYETYLLLCLGRYDGNENLKRAGSQTFGKWSVPENDFFYNTIQSKCTAQNILKMRLTKIYESGL